MVGPVRITSTLGSRLRAARERAGLSCEALAARAGVHPATLYRWQADSHEPTAHQLHAVADALGVTMEWLLSGRHAAGPPAPGVGVSSTAPTPPEQAPGAGLTRP